MWCPSGLIILRLSSSNIADATNTPCGFSRGTVLVVHPLVRVAQAAVFGLPSPEEKEGKRDYLFRWDQLKGPVLPEQNN